jgi:polygalacturonase|eukprot:COSAG06_NODE_1771_length_8429_cov_4.298679_9_plen_66_part_00
MGGVSITQLANFQMVDSPFWNNHFWDCDDVWVHDMTVTASPTSPNTDGFDPDSSRNVLIEDSYYR